MGSTRRNGSWDREWVSYCRQHKLPWLDRYRSTSDKYLTRDGLGKGPGYEYWSRRPFSGSAPGNETKRMTNRYERRTAREPFQDGRE